MNGEVRNADDVIKVIVPHFYKNGGEIPAQIREETIQAIKKSMRILNGSAHSFDGYGSWRPGGGKYYEKVTIIESQGNDPFSEKGMLSISEEMLHEVTILKESRGIRERIGERTSDVKPPKEIKYGDGSGLLIYDYLYVDSDHHEGAPVHLVEHLNNTGEIVARYYYPRNFYEEGRLKANFMPSPDDYQD